MQKVMPQTLEVLPDEYSIHRLPPEPVDAAAQRIISAMLQQDTELFALLKSKRELSLVCVSSLPINAQSVSTPWRALRVAGQLDFALTGILASLTAALASADISVFAVSSYDTDYLLVGSDQLPATLETLTAAGHSISQREAATHEAS